MCTVALEKCKKKKTHTKTETKETIGFCVIIFIIGNIFVARWPGSRAWYGTEILVWNMEDARMEWKTIFYTNFILDFAHGICRKIYTNSDN